MDRDYVLRVLREHEAELKGAGLLHLRLFGSVARGEADANSDIDLLADFHPDLRLSLRTLARQRNRLCDLLDAEVHLSNAEAMYPAIRSRVLPEAILAF